MTMINICKEINCPYFSGDCKTSYGCQRYQNSESCHLKRYYMRANDGYALHADDMTQTQLDQLKAENDRHFVGDPQYQKDIKFQSLFPEVKKHHTVRRIES